MLEMQHSAGKLHKISNYDGKNGTRVLINLGEFSSQEKNLPWNFFRTQSNHSYVQDGIETYGTKCKNNLLISSIKGIELENICNAFVSFNQSQLEIFPIFEIKEGMRKAKDLLKSKKINYHIPKSVLKRIKLSEKNEEEIEKQVYDNYGFKLNQISNIQEGRAKNGIFYLKDQQGQEFVLKYLGRNEEKIEKLLRILREAPSHFPKNYLTKKGKSSFNFGEELFGLEEFIPNNFPKARNLDYLSLLGVHIGQLHNELNFLLEEKNKPIQFFEHREDFLSESAMISSFIDFYLDSPKNNFLLKELELLVENNFSEKTKNLPRRLIHKDINHSNVLWPNEYFPKIIDPETLGKSMRINEFISPLLFGGNMTKPNYLIGGMERILQGYGESTKSGLSQSEMEVLPSLLVHSILTNYVVRKIRRNGPEDAHLNNAKINLSNINSENKK